MSLHAPPTDSELLRLARLKSMSPLDSGPDALFDSFVDAAADLCAAPIAMICLADENGFWVKACIGADASAMRQDPSLYAQAAQSDDIFEVESTLADARFAQSPIVCGAPDVQFFAGAPIILSEGIALGTLCVVDHVPRKLTDLQRRMLRKLAHSTMHALEARERSVVLYRSTPAALFSVEPDGRLLVVSDTFAAEVGYSRDELIGRTLFDLMTPGSAASARDLAWPLFLRVGRTCGDEYQLVHRDGSLIDVAISQTLERDASGQPVRLMGVFENITLRRRAEKALREESLRKARILEGTSAGTWEINLVTRESRYNERWAEMVGYTLSELGKTTVAAWSSRVHPQDKPLMQAAIEAHIREGSRNFSVESRLRHRDGRWIWVHDRGCVTEWGADGRPLWMYGICTDITARKEAEAALRESQAFLERVGQIAGVGGWELEFETNRVAWSAETCRLHDCEPGHQPTLEEAISYIDPQARPLVEHKIRDAVQTGESFDLELPMTTVTGRRLWARAVASVKFDEGRAVRLVGAVQDITRHRQIEQDLAQSRELLQVTLDSIADAVITTDTEARVQWLNPVAERTTGWSKAEAVGKRLTDIYIVVDEQTRNWMEDPATICLAKQEIVGTSGRIVLIARDGREHGIEHSASPIRGADGQIHGTVLVFHDVSEHRRLVDEISHRATHDPLTGLFNRSEFEARIKRLLETSVVHAERHVLLYIDLDQFKLVNDACGHSAGDQLLRQVSTILSRCVRSHDTLARLGGDEFGIILEFCDVQDAQRVAQKICNEMDAFRFTHEVRRFRVGASIGLVQVDDRWSDMTALMQAADASCYAAKEGGRNRVHTWFDSDQVVATRNGEMQWVSRIELALDENRFELFGQRITDCVESDGVEPSAEPTRGLHFEVLLRMRETNGTLVAPGSFLPIAERFHLATRIDRWVVAKAFDWLRVAQQKGTGIDIMAINLSGQSLCDRAFHRDVIQMVGRAPFDVRKLCFEITETAAITHLNDARAFIEEIRGLGVKVALDDFGAGASSFGYLKSLPVDFLKIDGHFIRNVLDDKLNNAAVRCFCDVARVVGVRTIAEFVETEAIREALHGLGVDMTQGYLIHRPEPLDSMVAHAAPAAQHAPVAKAA